MQISFQVKSEMLSAPQPPSVSKIEITLDADLMNNLKTKVDAAKEVHAVYEREFPVGKQNS